MKGKKVLKIFGISICFICICIALLFFLVISWGVHLFKETYLKSYNPTALVEAGQWKRKAPEVNNFAKWITIDEIPPASDIRAIILLDAAYYIYGCKSCKEAEAIDVNAVERFIVIGDPNEVGKIIGRNISSGWIIGDFCDMKKIMNGFRNATRCKDIASKLFDGGLSIFLAYIHFEASVAWDFYTSIVHGSSIKNTYWEFPADGYAIFVTESRRYALKYGIDERTIYGPDYYSREVYKDLMSLYNRKNRDFQSGRRKRMGEL